MVSEIARSLGSRVRQTSACHLASRAPCCDWPKRWNGPAATVGHWVEDHITMRVRHEVAGIGFGKILLLGAGVWSAAAAVYGAVEAGMNTAVGLYQPLAIWMFAVGVYAVLGMLSGTVAGGALAAARALLGSERMDVAAALIAFFVGSLLLAAIGLFLNDRVLPDLLAPSSLVWNTVLLVACAVASVGCYLHLRPGPGMGVAFRGLCFTACVALLVSAFLYVNMFVNPGASLTRVLVVYAALIGGCTLLYAALLALSRVPRWLPLSVVGAGLLLLVVLSGMAAQFRSDPGPDGSGSGRPNLLWIVMDTTRADHLSVYGYPRPTSPNIDALAAEGVVFENAIAQSSWTMPTHFQMVTSRAVAGKEKILDDSFVTAAEILKEQGYDTAAILANYSLGRRSGFEQGFDTVMDGPVIIFYLAVFEKLPVVKLLLRANILPADFVLRMFERKIFLEGDAARADAITDRALGWMEQRGEKPFFLFINYMDPHDCYDPPQPFRDAFAPGADSMIGFVRWDLRKERSISSNDFVRDVLPRLSEQDWKAVVDLYDAEIAYLDHEMGRMFAWLKARGQYDDTVIVISADHGELFGEHGLANHFKALSEEELHVPLVLRYPERLPGGMRVSPLIQMSDVLPTVLELLEVTSVPEMDGQSLMPLVARGERPNPEIFSCLIRRPDPAFPHTAPGHLVSVRTPESKYVWSSTGQHAFYDLRDDPEAHRNVYADVSDRPDVHAAAQRVEEWKQRVGIEGRETYEPDDALTTERLRALGYVQ
jgi:arylsulfatase A-like enzyme